MTKLSLCAIALPAALLAASAADAQQYAGHCSKCQSTYGRPYADEFKATYHENAMWPSQYVWPSRRAICQTWELTAANGWRRNNLLGKYDFATEGEGLSEAGKLRVERILTYAPPQRRTIFVQRALDAEQTAQRVEAVQSFAATRMPGAGAIDVQETYLQDDGHPAAGVDAIFTGFGANQPAPVLPSSNSTGSGDSGTGS
jgi:hypothetical protein